MKISAVASPPVVDGEVRTPSPKRVVWLSSAAHFSTDLYNGFLGPLMPLLVVRLDITMAMAGALVSVLSIFSSMLHPVAGYFADRLKRNYFILLGPLLAGVFMSMIGLAQSYLALIVVLSLSGIGTSLFHPQAAALVGRTANGKAGISMSIFAMGGTLGVALGPYVIIPVVTAWGMAASVVTVIPAILIVILAYPLLNLQPPTGSRHGHISVVSTLRGAGSPLVVLYLLALCRSTFIICFQSFMPLLLTERGGSLFLGAASFSILQVTGAAGLLVGGILSDRMAPRNLMQLSYLAALPCGILFLVFPSGPGLVFIGLASFFLLMSLPVNILAGQLLLPRHASLVSGILMGLSWGVGGLLATPLGALADHIGLRSSLLLISGLSAVGFLLARFSPGTIWQAKISERPDSSQTS